MTIQEKIRATINTNIVNSVPGTMLVRDVDRLTNKILTDEAALGVVIVIEEICWECKGTGKYKDTNYECEICGGEKVMYKKAPLIEVNK